MYSLRILLLHAKQNPTYIVKGKKMNCVGGNSKIADSRELNWDILIQEWFDPGVHALRKDLGLFLDDSLYCFVGLFLRLTHRGLNSHILTSQCPKGRRVSSSGRSHGEQNPCRPQNALLLSH